MSNAVQVQDTSVLGELALAAARNAQRLLADAELLLKRGRWPTAHSTAILAFEEAGKAWGCTIIMFAPEEIRSEFTVSDLTRGNSHILKLVVAFGAASFLAFLRGAKDAPDSVPVPVADLAPLVLGANAAKQRGLYVDFRDDAICDPASIGREEAARTVQGVRDALYYGAVLTDPEYIAFLEAPPDEVIPVRDRFWSRVLPAMQAGDEEAAATAMRQWMDDLGGTEDLREFLPAEAARLAAERAAKVPKRAQPRRAPSRRNRKRPR